MSAFAQSPFTFTPTATHSATFTVTPTISPTATVTPTITISPTISPTSTVTLSSTVTPSPTQSSTATIRTGLLCAYPNPATDQVNFDYFMDKGGRIYFMMYNMAGELVAKISENKSNGGQVMTKWDTWQTPPGIYLVKVRINYHDGSNHEFSIKKIAIMNK